MYRRSSLGLTMLIAVASCVPPQSLAGGPRTTAVQAPQPTAPHYGIAPGTILAQMPEMPLPPPPTPGVPIVLQAAPAFVDAAQSTDDASRALDCLTAAVYYEARSESEDGQRAVAQVVLNRVRNPAFPGSVCGVVYQGSYRTTGCQFSFTCDGSLLRPREPGAWAVARQIAQTALAGDVYAPVGSAMYYHTTAVHPFWENSLTPVTVIGAHIFYRWGSGLDNSFAFRQSYAGIEPNGAGQAGWDDAKQVLVRYGTTESAGVMIHRGGGDEAALAAAAASPTTALDPATLATVAGVVVHTGGGMAGGGMADGGNAPGVRLHYGGGAKPAQTQAPTPAPAETAQSTPAPAAPADTAPTAPTETAAARD